MILPYTKPTRPMAMIGRRDPRLRMVSSPLNIVDDHEQRDAAEALAGRMVATLNRLDGLALAAPQVGVNVRLVVTNECVAYINPMVSVLADHDGNETAIEACLSIPGRMFAVPRARHIRLTVQTLDGQWHVSEHHDLAARMWQHEVDHLDGTVIGDVWPETNPRATPLPTGAAERLGMNSIPGRSAGAL